jgi:hypothetical protein
MEAEIGKKYRYSYRPQHSKYYTEYITVKSREIIYQGVKDPIILLSFVETIVTMQEKEFFKHWELDTGTPVMKRSDFKEITPEMFETCEKIIKAQGRCSSNDYCNIYTCPFSKTNAIDTVKHFGKYCIDGSSDNRESIIVESAQEFLKFREPKEEPSIVLFIETALSNRDVKRISVFRKEYDDRIEKLKQCKAKLAEDNERLKEIVYKRTIEGNKFKEEVNARTIFYNDAAKEIERLKANNKILADNYKAYSDTLKDRDNEIDKLKAGIEAKDKAISEYKKWLKESKEFNTQICKERDFFVAEYNRVIFEASLNV